MSTRIRCLKISDIETRTKLDSSGKGYVAIAQKQPKREGISDECDREHLPLLPFSSWDCFYNGDLNEIHDHPEKVLSDHKVI